MNLVKDTGNGSFIIKKGFTYAITSLFIIAIGSSWSFTWGVASERQIMVDTVRTHVGNSYIHDMNGDHITKEEVQHPINKEDMALYFAPIIQQLKNIEEDIKEIKNKR